MSSNSILPDIIKDKYSHEISFIRKCAKSNNIKISPHAYKQISQRKIKIKDVYESVRTGTVVEIQNFERDTKIVFQDSVNNPPIFFAVIAIKPTKGLCVTAYPPDESKWVLVNNTQWRRRRDV